MFLRRLQAAILCLLCFCSSALGDDFPPRPSGPLTDSAGVLSDAEAHRIGASLGEMARRSGSAVVVVAIEDRATYAAAPSLMAFGRDLFNAWGIGASERNDGVLLLISVRDREAAIILGAAYGQGYDVVAQDILVRQTLPALTGNQYAAAIEATIPEIERRIVEPRASRSGSTTASDPTISRGQAAAFAVALIAVISFILRRRRTRGTGSAGGAPVRRRDSDDDRARRNAKDRRPDDARSADKGGKSDGGGASGRW